MTVNFHWVELIPHGSLETNYTPEELNFSVFCLLFSAADAKNNKTNLAFDIYLKEWFCQALATLHQSYWIIIFGLVSPGDQLAVKKVKRTSPSIQTC